MTDLSKEHSMDFGRVLFQQRSEETVYRHLHYPGKNN